MRCPLRHLTDADRQLLRETIEAQSACLILVTRGADTMVETARVLAAIPNQTLVLTGALNPARFRGSDAEFNIGCAVGAVRRRPAGVYIAMNGRIGDPAAVRKNVAANRFEAIDWFPSARAALVRMDEIRKWKASLKLAKDVLGCADVQSPPAGF